MLARIMWIHKALESGQSLPPAGRLADQFSVDARTVRRDLKFLREHLGAPLVYDRRRGCYRYSEAFHALPELMLSHEEVAVMLALARRFQRLEPLIRVVNKVTAGIADEQRQALEQQVRHWLGTLVQQEATRT